MLNSQINEFIPKIQEYLSAQPVVRAWLFGSYSRGEENADSDVDILVDYDHSAGKISLFKMGGMLMDLSEILGKKVDLVDNEGLLDFARPSIDRDKILIYERSA